MLMPLKNNEIPYPVPFEGPGSVLQVEVPPNTSISKNDSSNRIIYVSGPINEVCAQRVISDIIKYESSDPFSDILMFIDSYGGYCDSFLSIHDMMKMSRCDIATVCIGKAMSAGQMLLMSGTKGKRFITPNSRVMIHSLSSGMYGKIHELDNEMEEWKNIQSDLESFILQYTKISKKEIRDLMSKNSYLRSSQVLKYGIVDYIIKKPSDFYSKIKI